ncbi:MAG TPA: cell wall hydrolase [Phenylobacterium sp.]|nr:cell wall hydrolase [Phenylobacterium sp.]
MGLLAAAGLVLAACAPARGPAPPPDAQAMVSHGLSDAALTAATARFQPAVLALAERHDPGLRRPNLWGRPPGWTSLDLRKIPDLGIPAEQGEDAVALNNLRPFAGLPIRPMRPFVLQADADDASRALHCMTQAIYYEAAREPVRGQEAIAQVVLNRLRHPAYPKSICGVVYQGSARPTGCQFTFTCDGALRWTPQPALWRQAQDVARRALAGFVDKDVGSATHYHAAYVIPYWAPTLVKMTQVGQHIFYRWTGPWGEPPAFTGHYEGRESDLSPALLASLDPRTQGGTYLAPQAQGIPAERKITLAVAGEVRTYNVVDPTTPTGERTRVAGTLYAARRQPTPEEVRQIDESLAAMDKGADSSATAPASPAKTSVGPKAEAQGTSASVPG